MRTPQNSTISVGLLAASLLALLLAACQPSGEPLAEADPWTGK